MVGPAEKVSSRLSSQLLLGAWIGALAPIGAGTAQAEQPGAVHNESARAETLARDLAGAQRDLDTLRARSALANAAWQEKLSQATRAVEEELKAAKARAAQAEAEAERARAALAGVEQDRLKHSWTVENKVDRSATTELLAQDLITLRKEVAALKARLGTAGADHDPTTTPELPPHSSRLDPHREVATTGSLGASEVPLPALTSKQNASPSAGDRPVLSRTPSRPTLEEGPLLKKAKVLLDRGDIAGARSMLAYAVQGGSPSAAYKLAETYDPSRLREWGVFGIRGDLNKARDLYERAHALGAAQAKGRLEALR